MPHAMPYNGTAIKPGMVTGMMGPFPYDAHFAQRPLNPNAVSELEYFNGFYYSNPNRVSLGRSMESRYWWQFWGRPMGSFLQGPRVVSVPQAIPSRYPNPYLRSGAPDSIVAYVKSVTAQILQNRAPNL